MAVLVVVVTTLAFLLNDHYWKLKRMTEERDRLRADHNKWQASNGRQVVDLINQVLNRGEEITQLRRQISQIQNSNAQYWQESVHKRRPLGRSMARDYTYTKLSNYKCSIFVETVENMYDTMTFEDTALCNRIVNDFHHFCNEFEEDNVINYILLDTLCSDLVLYGYVDHTGHRVSGGIDSIHTPHYVLLDIYADIVTSLESEEPHAREDLSPEEPLQVEIPWCTRPADVKRA